MRPLRAFVCRLRASFNGGSNDLDLAEEMEFHLQMQIADNLHAGMTPDEARRLALVKSGGLESAREAFRDRRGLPFLDALQRDLRYGLRMLRKSPVFTSVVVTTLAVCIGANTALFSLIDGVVLRPLPYPDADRLVVLANDAPNRPAPLVSYGAYQAWRQHTSALSDLALCTRDTPVTLDGASGPQRVDAAQASANLFAVMGVPPALGRTFSDRDANPVVISHHLWQNYFGRSMDVLGRTLTVDGRPATVVGVMPRSFQYPSQLIELWRPATPRTRGMLVGRLRAGALATDAEIERARFEASLGGASGHMLKLEDYITGKPIRIALWSLFGAVTFVLLIGCTNVSNLLLARARMRQHELAIRAAMGAGRRRLFGHLMAENMLLCAFAGTAGILLAFFALRALIAFAPAGTPRLGEVAIDARVLSFTLILSCACTFLFGLLPALQITRCDPQDTLRAGGGNALRRPPGRHTQSTLIVVEFSLALVLLCGAGLMLRSLVHVRQLPLGYDPHDTLTFRVSLPDDQPSFYEAALREMEQLPGVASAGAVSNLSITYNRGASILTGRSTEQVMDDAATPGFFSTLGVALRRGRYFNANDDLAAPPVALVNEALAGRLPGGDAVGQQFRFADGRYAGAPVTIVGVVADMRRGAMEKDTVPQLFLPLAQSPNRGVDFVVRTAAGAQLEPDIRRALAVLDARVPVYHFVTLGQRVAATLAPRRFETGLLSLFAAVALFLAAVGIYGVMHYSVAQRTNEIGIRMASGATHGDVLAMVLRQGLRLTAIGIAAGVAGVLLLNRVFASLPLFGVTPTDPLTFILVAALLAGVAALACCVPAFRAATVDPVLALRHD